MVFLTEKKQKKTKNKEAINAQGPCHVMFKKNKIRDYFLATVYISWLSIYANVIFFKNKNLKKKSHYFIHSPRSWISSGLALPIVAADNPLNSKTFFFSFFFPFLSL